MILDAVQLRAIETAVSNPFTMITGGAGTGKTTIIKTIAEQVKAVGGSPTLCAFAGKAAARLKEATGFQASTIHRMLGADGSGRFARENLYGESVIVDEASMIPSDLLAEIISRQPARLVLVGDQAQLPPVGRGQPFHDLIRLRPELVCELAHCYRASEAVYHAATEIRGGLMPALSATSANEAWEIRATGDPEKTQEAILDIVRAGFVDFSQDIILVPRNGGKEDPDAKGAGGMQSTVASLNQAIMEIVNPRKGESKKIAAGDRVINTKNLPGLNIWNGTTGEVVSIDMDGGVWIKLDTPIADPFLDRQTDSVLLSREEAKHLELAYALTVHKAQGSQYRRVVFACLSRDSFALLDRPLIYTAITRTRQHCVVMGQVEAFRAGIGRIKTKRTVLQELAK
jgi:exodeoxyribonuclease V alpha subunit